MKRTVKLTASAIQDMREIGYYIAQSSKDKSIAARFVKELRERCKILEDFPECGAIPTDRVMASAGYRYLVHKDYLIFYTYSKEDDTVYILSVFNSKLDYMRVMKRYLR